MRPYPPQDLASDFRYPEAFEPAPDLAHWLRVNFIDDCGPLFNPDHSHLQLASIGVLWTNVPNSRQGMTVAGTASIPKPMQGDKWTKARLLFQLGEWFGDLPDFLITLDAPICAEASDKAFCALVEHELYHCAQAVNEFGMLRFNKDSGRPIFSMRGHDVEEFVGVVRRYGASGVLSPKVREMVLAAQEVPTAPEGAIRFACGTCGSMVR